MMLKKLLLTVLVLLPLQGVQAAEEKLPPVEVFVPGLCLACLDWADHLRQNGFSSVTVKEVADMATLKKRRRRIWSRCIRPLSLDILLKATCRPRTSRNC